MLRFGEGPLSDFNASFCRRLMIERRQLGHRPATILTLYGALGAFARWCQQQGYLHESPLRGIPVPKVPVERHRFLSLDELARIWLAAKESRRKPEDNMLILLLLAQGLRATELVSIRWIDVGGDRLFVAFGKGRTQRTVLLSEPAQRLLERRTRAGPRVFAMSTAALRDRLLVLGKAAKVPHVHPHLFRHTWASHFLLAAGIEAIEAMRILGGWKAGSEMLTRYARSVIEEAALSKARAVNLDLFSTAATPPASRPAPDDPPG